MFIPVHKKSLLEMERVVDLLCLATCLVELESRQLKNENGGQVCEPGLGEGGRESDGLATPSEHHLSLTSCCMARLCVAASRQSCKLYKRPSPSTFSGVHPHITTVSHLVVSPPPPHIPPHNLTPTCTGKAPKADLLTKGCPPDTPSVTQ